MAVGDEDDASREGWPPLTAVASRSGPRGAWPGRAPDPAPASLGSRAVFVLPLKDARTLTTRGHRWTPWTRWTNCGGCVQRCRPLPPCISRQFLDVGHQSGFITSSSSNGSHRLVRLCMQLVSVGGGGAIRPRCPRLSGKALCESVAGIRVQVVHLQARQPFVHGEPQSCPTGRPAAGSGWRRHAVASQGLVVPFAQVSVEPDPVAGTFSDPVTIDR